MNVFVFCASQRSSPHGSWSVSSNEPQSYFPFFFVFAFGLIDRTDGKHYIQGGPDGLSHSVSSPWSVSLFWSSFFLLTSHDHFFMIFLTYFIVSRSPAYAVRFSLCIFCSSCKNQIRRAATCDRAVNEVRLSALFPFAILQLTPFRAMLYCILVSAFCFFADVNVRANSVLDLPWLHSTHATHAIDTVLVLVHFFGERSPSCVYACRHCHMH